METTNELPISTNLVDLRDAFIEALNRSEALNKSGSLDPHEIMDAFQQALTAFSEETEWDIRMKQTATLFVLTVEDAQIMAGDLIGRDLTGEEIRRVTKMVESGLDEWHEIMRIAIMEAVKEP